MQQSIHQENQKKIKRGKLAGAALGAAGLILFILALATSAGSFTPLALLGLAMAAAGVADMVLHHGGGLYHCIWRDHHDPSELWRL
ncbi:MAG: hypothetical protein K1W26_13260 [Acetatifactor sp.]